MVQIVLSVVTIIFTYQIAKIVFSNEKIACIASVLLGLNLESITHSYYLLSEKLFTFIFVSAIFVLIQAVNSQKINIFILSAVLLSLSVLIRPFALYLPIILVGVIVFDRKPWLSRMKNAFFFLSLIILLIGGWVVRNKVVVGVPTISTISSHSLLYYNAASLVADLTDRNEQEVCNMFISQVVFILDEQGLPDTEANRYKIENELARKIILEDPFRYAFIHLKSDLNNLLPDTDILEIFGSIRRSKGHPGCHKTAR